MDQISFDFNHMMDSTVMDGLNHDDFVHMQDSCQDAFHALKRKRAEKQIAWADLPYEQEEVVKEIMAYAKEVQDRFDAFVLLGIGGSALGPLAVFRAIHSYYYNELPKEKRKFPKFYVLDNVDPERFCALLEIIDLKKTLFNVVSKSGSTSETMSQFMIIRDLLMKECKDSYHEHLVCTTDQQHGNLIKIAQAEQIKTFYIPQGVGGRFSELSPVGLLPAACLGIDIEEMLEGAKAMDAACKCPKIHQNPALCFALLQVMAMKKGKNIVVMMPYADSLQYFADWFAQLWAESLGKRYDNNKREIFAGQTPIKALGVTDQHSQVQLYTEGPFDKVVVFLTTKDFKTDITIPKLYEDIPSLSFLGGISHKELLSAERFATEFALVKAGRMNLSIELSRVNAHNVGMLLYFFEMATAYAGELLQLNAYDQPGVEEGKNATYAIFGRPGYEEKKKELDQAVKKNKQLIMNIGPKA